MSAVRLSRQRPVMTDFFAPRLYLITPALSEAGEIAAALEAALDQGDVACVLLRFAVADEGERKKIVKALAPLAQQAEAALLIEGDAQLAARAGADGVHVEGFSESFEEALDSLKPERIVGLGGLASRDEAMRAGETEVDYLMFGGLEPNGASAEEIFEQAGWWAEVFNVPCVAVAHAPEDVARLARCGAEFLGLGPKFFDAPEKLAALVAEAQAEIDALEPEE